MSRIIVGHAWLGDGTIGLIIKHDEKTGKFEAKIKTLVGLSGFNEIADKEYVADWGSSLPIKSACSLVNECGIWDDPKLAEKILE